MSFRHQTSMWKCHVGSWIWDLELSEDIGTDARDLGAIAMQMAFEASGMDVILQGEDVEVEEKRAEI